MRPLKLDALLKTVSYAGVWIVSTMLIGVFAYQPIASWFRLDAPFMSFSWVTLEGAAFFAAVMAASMYGAKMLDRRPWQSLGVRVYPKALAELGLGLAIGVLTVAMLWLIDGVWFWAIDGAPIVAPRIHLPVEQMPVLIVFMAFVAFNEELLVRGYPLQTLIRGFGVLPALVATSVLFGLFHITGDAWNAAVVVLETACAGALFALCYLKTKALWMPIGIHFANNVTVFALDNPPLDAINVLAPDVSQAMFWQWWWMNFPVYVIFFVAISRWRYRPDSGMQAYFEAFVKPLGVGQSENIENDEPHAQG